jgi:hypothetical protein
LRNLSDENLRQIDKLSSATLAILDETRPAYSCRDDVLKLKSIFEELRGKSIEPALDISTAKPRPTVALRSRRRWLLCVPR